MITSIACQVTSALAAILRVRTTNYRVSRGLGVVSLAAIAGDYGSRYLTEPSPIYLIGGVMLTVSTTRTLCILLIPVLDRNHTARRAVCALSLVINSTLTLTTAITIVTSFALLGLVISACAEASNAMKVRRPCLLTAGIAMGAFGVGTEAWGLVAKSLISDVGASLYYMVKYRT